MIETGERRDVPRIIVPAVQTTLIRPGEGDMEIFLGLRATNTLRLQWAPPGGKVDPGETDEEAGIRELGEEAGIKIGKNHLRHFKHMPMSSTLGELDGQPIIFQSVVRVFLVDGRGLEPYNASPREHLEMRWMKLREAYDMHQRILALRGETENRHNIPGTLTPGTFKTVKWLMGKEHVHI